MFSENYKGFVMIKRLDLIVRKHQIQNMIIQKTMKGYL